MKELEVPSDFSTDPFLDKVYIKGKYNCLDFTAEVWEAITGERLGDRLGLVLRAIPHRKAHKADIEGFRLLDRPQSPCLAMFRRAYTEPHIGVYVRGRLLHLPSRGNAVFQRLDEVTRFFKRVAYYQ
jgi:hypothetical protein